MLFRLLFFFFCRTSTLLPRSAVEFGYHEIFFLYECYDFSLYINFEYYALLSSTNTFQQNLLHTFILHLQRFRPAGATPSQCLVSIQMDWALQQFSVQSHRSPLPLGWSLVLKAK